MKPAAAAFLSFCLAALPALSRADDFTTKAIGTAGSEFLTVDLDPRGIAMGGALTAVCDDPYSLHWNPAGLSLIPRAAAAATHNEYVAGIRVQSAAYAQRLNETSVLAGAFRHFDAGAIVNTDISGNHLGSFRPRSLVLEGGWAQSVQDLTDSERDVSLGLGVKFFQTDMIAKAEGYAVDLGMMSRYTDAPMPFQFGASLQNMGRGQRFDRVRDTLPFQGRLGASVRPRQFLLLTLDGVIPVSNHPYAAIGSEFELDTKARARIFLRGGYSMRSQFSGLDGISGVSFGFGLKAADLRFDYAFAPLGALGTSHRIGVGWALPAKSSRRFRTR